MAANKNTINPNLVILVGAGALLYFGVANPLLKFLGLKDGKDDKAAEKENDAAKKAPGWNPNYWIDNRPKGVTICLMTDAKATRLANQIEDAWGFFNDDENAIFAAFRELRSQIQLSQLCAKYSTLFKKDLLTRLTAKWSTINDGLEPEDFLELAKIVNKLPINVTNCG